MRCADCGSQLFYAVQTVEETIELDDEGEFIKVIDATPTVRHTGPLCKLCGSAEILEDCRHCAHPIRGLDGYDGLCADCADRREDGRD